MKGSSFGREGGGRVSSDIKEAGMEQEKLEHYRDSAKIWEELVISALRGSGDVHKKDNADDIYRYAQNNLLHKGTVSREENFFGTMNNPSLEYALQNGPSFIDEKMSGMSLEEVYSTRLGFLQRIIDNQKSILDNKDSNWLRDNASYWEALRKAIDYNQRALKFYSMTPFSSRSIASNEVRSSSGEEIGASDSQYVSMEIF